MGSDPDGPGGPGAGRQLLMLAVRRSLAGAPSGGQELFEFLAEPFEDGAFPNRLAQILANIAQQGPPHLDRDPHWVRAALTIYILPEIAEEAESGRFCTCQAIPLVIRTELLLHHHATWRVASDLAVECGPPESVRVRLSDTEALIQGTCVHLHAVAAF